MKLNLDKMNLHMSNYNFILNGLNENDKITHFSFNYNPNVKPRLILEYFLHRKKLNSIQKKEKLLKNLRIKEKKLNQYVVKNIIVWYKIMELLI